MASAQQLFPTMPLPPASFRCTVHSLSGDTVDVVAKSKWNGFKLKCEVGRELGIFNHELRLVYELRDIADQDILTEIFPKEESTVDLTLIRHRQEELFCDADWPQIWRERCPRSVRQATKTVLDRQGLRDLVDPAVQGTVVAGKWFEPRLPWRSGKDQERTQVTPLTTVEQLLAYLRENSCSLEMAGSVKIVDLTCRKEPRYVDFDLVVLAALSDPVLVLHDAPYSVASEVVSRFPGMFRYLPKELQGYQALLHKALEQDATLCADFDHTAGATERRRFQWHREEEEQECLAGFHRPCRSRKQKKRS